MDQWAFQFKLWSTIQEDQIISCSLIVNCEFREKVMRVRELDIVQASTSSVMIIFHFCHVVVVFCLNVQQYKGEEP